MTNAPDELYTILLLHSLLLSLKKNTLELLNFIRPNDRMIVFLLKLYLTWAAQMYFCILKTLLYEYMERNR